jgi:hypothetical protein
MPDTRATSGGQYLTTLMARRGWTAGKVSELTQGEVSESSVRAWAAGQYVPRITQAHAVAKTFDLEGVKLLQVWKYRDAADGLRHQLEARNRHVHGVDTATFTNVSTLTYPGPALDEQAQQLVRAFISWLQLQQR